MENAITYCQYKYDKLWVYLTMEQLFGKTIAEEKPLDYVPEIILLLLIIIIIFVSASYLFYLERNSKIAPVHKPPINNSELVNTSGQVALPNHIITEANCDLSVIYLRLLPSSISPTEAWQTSNSDTYSIISNSYPANSEIVNSNLKSTVATENYINIAQIITPAKTIYQALSEEFKNDLPRWSANIDYSSLTINFQTASFDTGGSMLDQQYQSILTEFCPRYITILNKYANNIEAISIEGHSSSEWQGTSPDDAYLNNMLLSQQRTNAVLAYCLRLPTIKPYTNWLRNVLITSGLSSSRLIMENEIENIQRSRRVEFKIQLSAD